MKMPDWLRKLLEFLQSSTFKGILECKNASAYRSGEFGEEGTDEIPTEYLLQVAHYRYVMELDYVDIAVLIGGNSYKQYRYTKNKALEDKMQEILYHFWKDHRA
jgi:predicted phage-related endonuclease